jgi:hypothetical protein
MKAERSIRNVLMLPLVILIRAPIMLGLNAIVWIGKRAEDLGDAINPYLPSLTSQRKGSR